MALRAMHAISTADTASPYAKSLADEIWEKLTKLSIELKSNRQD